MSAQIIDGTALAEQRRTQIKQRVADLRRQHHPVQLTALLVGTSAAGEMYAQRQGEACRGVGIDYSFQTLPGESTAEQVSAALNKLNHDTSVTGIMLLQPLPAHLDGQGFQHKIDPAKDVEGISAANLGYLLTGHAMNIPCTALAAFELVKSTGVKLRGAEAVIVGGSEIVGKPIALLLSDERATVTMCRSATRDLPLHTKRAEVLVVAVGKAGLIGADHVREGAVVVDVGINRLTLPDGKRKTVGDVDYEAVKEKAGFITPVPGGVGPMTVAMLLENTVRSAEQLLARRA